MESKVLNDMVIDGIQAVSLPVGFDIRLYRPGDELYIEPVENILREHPYYGQEWEKMLRAGYVMTGLYQGEPIGVGGIMPIRDEESKAIIWFIVSQKIKKVRAKAWRTIKLALSIIQGVFGFSELWAYARTNSLASMRTLEHLGFQRKEILTLNQKASCWLYIKEK